jgi:hypothetical protein
MSREFTSGWLAMHNAKRQKPSPDTGRKILANAEKEVRLHERIMEWCSSQWPRWLYIHARTDMASTIQIGAPDFVIIAPGGRIFFVECKSATGKQTTDQLAWMALAQNLGHKYYLVRSFEEFLEVVK